MREERYRLSPVLSLKSVRNFAQAFKQRRLPLHVLVNNAGTMMVPESNTEDGFEFHFELNYLGHFLLTNLLLDTLKKSGRGGCCSRIINMSSATHYAGVMHMDDLLPAGADDGGGVPVDRQRRGPWHGGHGAVRQPVEPRSGHEETRGQDPQTPAEGASISVYAAAASEMEGVGGCYLYNGEKRQSSPPSYDSELQAELWKKSCELVGL